MRFFLQKIVLGFVLALAVVCAVTQPVSAATIYVNSSTGDDTTGDGTVSAPYKTFHKGYTEAVANDTLDLTGTFSWTDAAETGDSTTSGYTIGKNLTIQGHSAADTIVQAHTADNSADRRVFTISLGVTATIQDVTIRYGKLTGSSNYGAGIENLGTLTVRRTTISYNRATQGGGGGISNEGALTVRDSTVHNNVVYYMGGGLLNHYDNPSATMDIINTTVAFNEQTATTAYTEGAGVYYRRGSGSVTNSTIVYNDGLSTSGLGLGDAGSTVYIKNTIIVGNTGNNEVGFRSSNNGTIVESGYNIFGKRSPYFTSVEPNTWLDQNQDGSFIKNIEGSLGTLSLSNTLADNDTETGTQTFAITSATSIAVNGGDTASHNSIAVPEQDQRGLERSGAVDVGAYEYGGTPGSDDDDEEDGGDGGGGEDPSPSSSGASSSSSTARSSSSSSGTCSDQKPVSVPDLFQINTTTTTAELFFTPSTETNKYYISFSTSPSAEGHGALVTLGTSGVQSFTVQYLQPGTIYYFKVRSQRGCQTGAWSSIVQESTQSITSETVQLQRNATKLQSSAEEDGAPSKDEVSTDESEVEQVSDTVPQTYRLKISVKNKNEPIPNSTVEIPELALSVVTDDVGEAVVEGVVAGAYTLQLVDQAYAAEEIILDGEQEEFDILLTVDDKGKQMYLIVAILFGTFNVILVLILLIRKRVG